MTRHAIAHSLLAGLFCFLLSACASGSRLDAPARHGGTPLPALPAPKSLALPESAAGRAQRPASFTDAQRRRAGSAFESSPLNRVLADADTGVYAPAWDSSEDGPAKLAYALYRFDLPGYADSPLIRLVWSTPPSEGSTWVALPNIAANRWEWFKAAGEADVSPASLLPYLEQDSLLLAVLLTGDDISELSYIEIGEDAVPLAQISANPDIGEIPFDADISAVDSSDSDGMIVKFEFDLDGDGTYEIDNGTDPDLTHNFDTVGSYTISVRVTDDLGAEVSASTTVSANPQGMEPPVAALSADPLFGDFPLDVSLDASASTDDMGIASYDWDINGDGVYEQEGTLLPTYETQYQYPGVRTAVVRVHDVQGATATASVQVDANDQPVVVLNVYPQSGRAPLLATFQANAGEPGGGLISINYDVDGDGDYEIGGTPDYSVQWSYPAWMRVTPRVMVTDNDGETASDDGPLLSITNWKAPRVSELLAFSGGAGPSICLMGSELGLSGHDFYASGSGIRYFRGSSNVSTDWVNCQVSDDMPPPGSNTALGATLGLSGARLPCIAYFDSDGDLVCARAKNATPDAMDDWVVANVQDNSSAFKGGYDCCIVTTGIVSNARIMISYYDTDGDELYFAVSQTAYPGGTGDWTRYILDSDGNCGQAHAMTLVNGMPAIVYTEHSWPNRLRYARATVANPTAVSQWVINDITLNVGGETTVYTGPSVAGLSSGQPVVAYSANYHVMYARAFTSTPTGPLSWNVTRAGGDYAYRTAVGQLDGVPIIAYINLNFKPCFLWSKLVSPAEPSDWVLDEAIIGAGELIHSSTSAIGMTLFNNRPAICMYDTFDALVLAKGE